MHAQSRDPDAVIVVDNASTDGTAAAVRAQFPAVHLAELTSNSGGAGGFAYGMALALAGGADLIWLMDDDTVPEPGALRALLAARDRHPGTARAGRQPGGLDRRARAPDEHPADQALRQQGGTARRRGRGLHADPFGIIRVDPGRRRSVPATVACRRRTISCGTTTSSSPPGCCAATPACSARRASPCTRRRRSARTDTDPGRSGSSTRSGTRSGCSRPARRSPRWSAWSYGGSTLRRWARTFAGSRDRRALGSSLVKGIAAGVRTSPRPTGRCSPESA